MFRWVIKERLAGGTQAKVEEEADESGTAIDS